jgi:hypothetical protein
MIALGAFSNLAHSMTITVSPDGNSVSDGIGSYGVLTVPANEIRARTPLFGEVYSCSLMIDIPVGTVHGNVSHGALCLRRIGDHIRHVFVCYDDMVGHAGLIMVHQKDATKVNLIYYTMERCFGG